MPVVPLMPKATAVWLVDNTSLTFEQIADFCGLHVLEVKGIADGDVAQGIRGLDPVSNGQLNRKELEKGQADPSYRLQVAKSKVVLPPVKPSRRSARYTPVSRRQDRPNAILWLLRHHPELKDVQIVRLVGTTKPTIQAVRERTHWNTANLQPHDPVTLGLCTQIDLDGEVQKAAKRQERSGEVPAVGTLLPAEETQAIESGHDTPPAKPVEENAASVFGGKNWDDSDRSPRPQEEKIDPDSVFAKLNTLKNDG